MSQPGRLLSLFATVIEAKVPGTLTGSLEVDQVIKTLPGLDLVRLLKHIRDWNARAKTSIVAQTILHAILRLRSADDIMKAFDSVTKISKPSEEDMDLDKDDNEEGERDNRPKKRNQPAPITLPELLDGLIPYSERHFNRVDKLVQESYMLDYALGEMDGGVFGNEVMEIDQDR